MAVLVLVVATTIALVLLAGCGAGTDDSFEGSSRGDETTGPVGVVGGKFTVASNVAYPPFEFSPRKGPRGFDIDLMNEIGKRAGFEVEYEKVQFDSICGVSTPTSSTRPSGDDHNQTREQQIDFSDPTSTPTGAPVVSQSEVQTVGDLADAPVGVQAGSTGQIEAKELLDGGQIGEIKPYRTIGEAFTALKDGEVEGVIYDLSAAHKKVVEGDGKIRFVEPVPTGEQYGIAFPKDSPLIDPVNQALAEIKDDGTYEKLYKKWIGMPPEEIP